MYFVHPQIKFNIKNLVNLLFCFFKISRPETSQKLQEMFPEKNLYFTDMGRSAFRLIVKELKLQNSEILVPAFICDIFYDIFKQYQIKPVFLDIDKKTFNLAPEEIEKKITPQTKSILICHTYGLPVNVEKITTLAKKYNLLVIEDCAHSFGAKYKGIFTGNFGDAAFFSLYKLFPTLRGGMAVLKMSHGRPTGEADSEYPLAVQRARQMSKTNFSLRDFISLLNCFSFFSFLFKKYAGEIAPKYIRKEKLKEIGNLNRVSKNIFSWQIKNFEEVLKKRRELALIFHSELRKLGFEVQNSENNTFTFLSALVPENIDRDKFVLELRKKGVFALRIWKEPIILNKEARKEYEIDLSRFPNAVETAKRIVNFPLQNFYTKKDIDKILRKIQLEL